MICRNCGKNVASGNFCRECGCDNTSKPGGNGFFDILSPEAVSGAESTGAASSVSSAELNAQKARLAQLEKQSLLNRIFAISEAGLAFVLLIVLIFAFVSAGDAKNHAENVRIEAGQQLEALRSEYEAKVSVLEDSVRDASKPYSISTNIDGNQFKTEIQTKTKVFINPNNGKFKLVVGHIDENSTDNIKNAETISQTALVVLDDVSKSLELNLMPPEGDEHNYVFFKWEEGMLGDYRCYKAIWEFDDKGKTDENGNEIGDGIPDNKQVKITVEDGEKTTTKLYNLEEEKGIVKLDGVAAEDFRDDTVEGITTRKYFTAWKVVEINEGVETDVDKKTNKELESITVEGGKEYKISANYNSKKYILNSYVLKNGVAPDKPEAEVRYIENGKNLTADDIKKDGYMIFGTYDYDFFINDTKIPCDADKIETNIIADGKETFTTVIVHYDKDIYGTEGVPDRCEVIAAYEGIDKEAEYITVKDDARGKPFAGTGNIKISCSAKESITTEDGTIKKFKGWNITTTDKNIAKDAKDWIIGETDKKELNVTLKVTGGYTITVEAVYEEEKEEKKDLA